MDRTGASDLAGLRNAKKINGKYCYFANIVFLCCKLPECFKSKGINHAFGVLMAGSQILFIAHIFSKFQTIKILRNTRNSNTCKISILFDVIISSK